MRRGVSVDPTAFRDSLLQTVDVLFFPSPSLGGSTQLCRRSGDRALWDLPFWKVILRRALEGGWLKVCARLLNWGESESSSGNGCQAEDTGDAGGVAGGESLGEASWKEVLEE